MTEFLLPAAAQQHQNLNWRSLHHTGMYREEQRCFWVHRLVYWSVLSAAARSLCCGLLQLAELPVLHSHLNLHPSGSCRWSVLTWPPLSKKATIRPTNNTVCWMLLCTEWRLVQNSGWLHHKSHKSYFSFLCSAALQALKRKKRYEKQLAQIDGTLSTIEFQREALENANTNTEVLKNMGFAAKAMKAAHDNM